MLRLNKKKKILISIAALVLAALVTTGYIVAYRYKAIIHKALPLAVADASDSLYRISVRNVSVNVLNRSVTLKGVHLWADSAEVARRRHDSSAKTIYLDITVPKLTVSGIMWDKLTGGEGYSCDVFSIVRPEIAIYKTDSVLTIYDTLSVANIAREFSAGTIKVTKGIFSYAFCHSKDTNAMKFIGCNIKLNDWELSNESLGDANRVLLAKYMTADIDRMLYPLANVDYTLSANTISYNTEDNNLTARNLQFMPDFSDEEMYRRMNRQKEIYKLEFPTIELTGIDRIKLLHKSELHASAIHLNHTRIDILMNRKLPPNPKSKLGNYPNQLLSKLKLPVYIPELRINNGSLTYSEIVEKTEKKGSIYFTDVNGGISNITNIAEYINTNKYTAVELEGKFNKYTDIKATFRFLLNDPNGNFTVKANMGALQSRQINEQAKAFSMIEIKSLNVRSMHIQLTGDESKASGTFTMQYNNLGIRILKKPENIEEGKRKKGLLTFIANNMVLYSNNPMPGDDVRKVQTDVKRDDTKSFFNLVWKNILQGVQETVIRDMEVIDWIRNNEKDAASKNAKIIEFFTKDKEKANERKQRRKERERNQ